MKCPSISSMAVVPIAILSLTLQAPVQAETGASGSTSAPATGAAQSEQAAGAGQAAPQVAPTKSNPKEEILWTIGPAKKRRANISVDV